MAFPVVGLLLIIKYLLDKDKQRETAHKVELEGGECTRSERKRGDDLQIELLNEARGHAVLAEELKNALQILCREDRPDVEPISSCRAKPIFPRKTIKPALGSETEDSALQQGIETLKLRSLVAQKQITMIHEQLASSALCHIRGGKICHD